MPLYLKRGVLFFLLGLLSSVMAYAQSSQDIFGQNRVQNKKFKWKYLSSYNFDVYYYGDNEALAREVASFSERELERITSIIGYSPYTRVKIMLYSSTEDMMQSNRNLETPNLNSGGHTKLVKSKMELAYRGRYDLLCTDITAAMSEMIIDLMLYGGSLKDVLQSAYLLSMPEWFSKGIAAYIAEGWSTKMDDRIRDIIVHGKLKSPAFYEGEEARIIGQSFFNYINKTQGESTIANILNLTRIMRDEEIGIENSISIPYSELVSSWKNYYADQIIPVKADYPDHDEKEVLKEFRKTEKEISDLKISPDGKQLAYSVNLHGRYSVVVKDISTGKEKVLMRGGESRSDLAFYSLHPALAWKNNTTVLVAHHHKGEMVIREISLNKGKTSIRKLPEFTHIHSIDVNKKGDTYLLCASKNGKADIFVYFTSSNKSTQLTNDYYDDLDAIFIEDVEGYNIVFCSNRTSDTLYEKSSISQKPENYSLYLWLWPGNKTSGKVFQNLFAYGNSSNPTLHNGELLFVNDEKGIENLYHSKFSSGRAAQQTRYMASLYEYAITPGDSLYYLSYYKGKIRMFGPAKFDNTANYNTNYTTRMDELLQENPDWRRPFTNNYSSDPADSLDVNFQELIFAGDTAQVSVSVTAPEDSIVFKGPYSYRGLFGTDKVVSAISIDPLRGFGILLETGMSDMFGNHRVDLGIFMLTDFRSSSVWGQYQYLEKRVDWTFRYDRYNLFIAGDVASQQYILNEASINASYPFSVTSRLSLGTTITATRFSDQSNISAISFPDVLKQYISGRTEYVYDNSRVYGLNMIKGSRMKAGYQHYVSLQDQEFSFGRLWLDMRHYQPIHKEIVWAIRGSFGMFSGGSPKSFLLGGMDNWLFNNTANVSSTGSPLRIDYLYDNSDLLFVRYVTNMRGFDYNTQFGSKYILVNTEVRFPIVLYFTNGSISSNFLRNLQLTAFTDIGTAWDGGNPFSVNNSINTQQVSANPFSATVVNYRSPFLIGIGPGLRSIILGYYTKVDVAWGIKDGQIASKPKFYLTFGYDF